MSGSYSSGGGTTDTTSSGSSNTSGTGASSWSPNQSVSGLYDAITQNLYSLANTEVPYYSGQTYVSPSELTQRGVATGQSAADAYTNAANSQNQIANTASGNYNFLSNAADVTNNQYVQAMNQQTTENLNKNLTENLLPAVNQGAASVNAMGSSRQGLAQGQAIGETQDAIANAVTNTNMQAYNSGLGAQQSALGQTGSLQNAQTAGAQSLNQASGIQQNLGQTVEGYQQQALDEAIDRYNYQYEEPWTRMNNVASYLTGLFGDTGTSYTSSNSSGTSSGTRNENTDSSGTGYSTSK